MTSGSLSINQWAEEDRPREKLARLGASALSNAELLAILIGSGTPEKSAVDLMKEILADCGNNLNQLGKLSLAELQRYKGVGLAKAVTIQAACEMGRRRQVSRPEERPRMDSADAIYREMHPRMQDLDVEEAWVVLANQSFRLIKVLRLSHRLGRSLYNEDAQHAAGSALCIFFVWVGCRRGDQGDSVS